MSLRFAGYAAVFDAVDRGGDVVRAGAFGRIDRPVPLLWQHGGAPVGVIERIGEDARGLRVVGRIDAPKLAGLVRAGTIKGLSFGYRVREARQGQVRELKSIDLIELSLVASPMQPLARVHAVENLVPRPHPSGAMRLPPSPDGRGRQAQGRRRPTERNACAANPGASHPGRAFFFA